MEADSPGRVIVEAWIENLRDVRTLESGAASEDQPRAIVVNDAVVDTGTTLISMPASLIQKLGLERTGIRRVRSAVGIQSVAIYDPVRFTIQGRDATIKVSEVPEGTPVLIGQVPLQLLDFVIDPRNHCLIGDPRHGGEWTYELY